MRGAPHASWEPQAGWEVRERSFRKGRRSSRKDARGQQDSWFKASARPGVGAQLGNYGYLPAAVSVVQSWSLALRCFLWPKPHTGFHNRSKRRLRNDYPQGKKFVLSSSIPSAILPSHQMSTISRSLIFFGRMHVPTRTLSIFELQRVWSLLLSVPFFHRGDLEDW